MSLRWYRNARTRRRTRLSIAGGTSLALVAALALSGPAFAGIPAAPKVQSGKPVPHTVVGPGAMPKPAAFAKSDPTVDSKLPAAGTALVDLAAAAAPAASAA